MERAIEIAWGKTKERERENDICFNNSLSSTLVTLFSLAVAPVPIQCSKAHSCVAFVVFLLSHNTVIRRYVCNYLSFHASGSLLFYSPFHTYIVHTYTHHWHTAMWTRILQANHRRRNASHSLCLSRSPDFASSTHAYKTTCRSEREESSAQIV